MNSDEQFSENADKQMLNQLWQENVISKPLKQNSKTPDVSTLLGFFFISEYKELYKECSKNLSLKYFTQTYLIQNK